MRYLGLIIWLFLFSCKKQKTISECDIPLLPSPSPSYSSPVWHPDGNLLGFNHLPISGVSTNGVAPCIWYTNSYKTDSAGFYLMNKDGTGFKRVTTFNLVTPSWSPDGNWIAYSYNYNIYKMPFNGNSFDTTQIVQLTNSGVHFNPTWTLNSDTIYYATSTGSSMHMVPYYIYKMAKDGSSKTMVKIFSKQPFIGSDNKIYFVSYVLPQMEIFSMNKDSSAVTQVTFNGKNLSRRAPKYYQSKVIFWDSSLMITPVMGFSPQELAKSTDNYDVSINGEIVYSSNEFEISDKRFRTLWIINADGTNNRQLTFNYY